MASDKGISSDALDERLASARDGLLLDGEKIVAQEEGDQGQAIVLTDSRVLVVKVGITATGTANGCVTGAFALSEVQAVNVRKGPLGAIIQVVADSAQISAQSGPPNNIVVFTGPQRVKRCEAIAVKAEAALGKPVGRVEPTEAEEPAVEQPVVKATAIPEVVESPPEPEVAATVQKLLESPVADVQEEPAAPPEKRKGGREPVSLADEMYAELTGGGEQPPAPVTEPPPALEATPSPAAPAIPEPSVIQKEAEVEPEAVPQFGPNPYLPRPVGRSRVGAGRALAGVGALMVLMMLGMAVTAPLRVTHESRSPAVSVSHVGKDVAALRRQQDGVTKYQAEVDLAVADSMSALSGLESALRSSNKSAMDAAVRSDTSDAVWRKMDSLAAPAGLVGAKENVVSGLFISKTAFLNIAAELQSNSGVNTKQTLARIAEAKAVLRKGAMAVERMRADLGKQIAGMESQKKRQH